MRRVFLLLLLSPALTATVLSSAVGARTAALHPLDGRVLDDAGRPIAGAEIRALPMPTHYERGRRQLTGAADGKADLPPAVATSAEDGRFRLGVPAAGVWQVEVRHEGYLPMKLAPLAVTAPAALAPVRLGRDRPTSIRVTGPRGRPIEGAWVFATPATAATSTAATGGWTPLRRLARTDRDGRALVPRGAGEGLTVHAFSPATGGVATATTDGDLELSLTGAAAAGGDERRTVEAIGPDGKGIAKALVVVGETGWPAGLTDGAGRLDLAGPADALSPVRVVAPDGATSSRVLGLAVDEPASGDPAPLRIRLTAATPVTGRVIEDESRRPLAGALVWSGHDPGVFTLSAADGSFLLTVGSRGRSWVQAERAGYLPRAARLGRADLAAGRAPALALSPAAALAGRVVDRDGEPLAGALIVASRLAPTARVAAFRLDGADARAFSGAGGEFVLAGLRPAGRYSLEASATGGRAVARVRPPARAELALRPDRPAFGRVVDEEDRPLASARVRITASEDRLGPADAVGGRFDPDDPFTAETGADGRFRLDRLPGDLVDLAATAEGFAPVLVRGVAVTESRSPFDLGTIALARGASIEGRALDPRGEPIDGVEVRLREESGSPAPAGSTGVRRLEPAGRSDAAGRFRIADLEPGRRWTVYLHREGYLPARLDGVAAPTDRALTATLEPAARIAGRIVDEADRPIAGAAISYEAAPAAPGELAPRRRSSGAGRSADDGSFELTGVAAGTIRLEVEADGFLPAEPRELETRAGGEIADLLIRLVEGAVLEGTVREEGGAPVAGASIRDDDGAASATTDADGAFRLGGLEPGERRITVRHHELNSLEEQVAVEPGINRADFVLAGGSPVSGRIVDPAGGPIEGAEVRIQRWAARDRRVYRALTDADGSFLFPRVADGGYHLRAHKPGWVPRDREDLFEVAGEAVEDLVLELLDGTDVEGRVVGLDFEELARTRITADNGAEDRAASVDYEGRFRVPDLAPGVWRLTAVVGNGERQAEANVLINPGSEVASRDVEFEPGLSLTAQVVHGGRPVPATRVRLRGLERTIVRSIVSDYDGRFRFADLPAGRYRIELSNPRESLLYRRDLDLETDLETILEIPTAELAGIVLASGSREPLADALVSLQELSAGGEAGDGSLVTLGTGADGRFRIERATAGRYRIEVRRNGYEPVGRQLELVGGEPPEAVEIALSPTPGLALRVRTPSGSPPELVTLTLLGSDRRPVYGETRVAAPDGSVRFESAPAGSWPAVVTAPGRVATEISVTVPSDEALGVLLEPEARLLVLVSALVDSNRTATVRLAAADGRPFRTVGPGGRMIDRWPVEAGAGRIVGLPPGAWTLRVTASDGQTWSTAATTTGGAVTRVVLP